MPDARNTLARLDQVITKGESVLETRYQPPGSAIEFLGDEDGYTQWRLSAQTLIQTLSPGGHFEREFDRVDIAKGGWESYPSRLGSQLGVMRALREDFEAGYVGDTRRSTPEDGVAGESNPGADEGSGPLVFISCGQATNSERRLGNAIAKMVKQMTGATGYFAQNQTSLDGLTKNVFGALNRATAFIAVMHKRGQVTNENGNLDRTRASVWIEQEIAIASFVQATRNADLKVAAYIEKDICLEGARTMLILNPQPFTTNAQVMKHLKKELQMWNLGRSAESASTSR